ncbi:ABC transporter permease [Natronorubrum aibiense]|uniref:ABC transporter permease subunit n=1 Tax=Natronorubrum aibiense TaxID=348826 RepID=A0A5P9P4B1_9EURY|nr:ABC transporter permease [Natronorubrum aibiense]QFU82906.1 ABC transporter permease subunit [Natronorubrum aibiense]
MTDDTPRSRETFEDVDWDEIDANGRAVSRSTLLIASAYALVVACIGYDFLLASKTDVLPSLGAVGPLEWLYVLTLLTIAVFALLALSEHRRMTAYYWAQFRKNTAAVVSLGYLLVTFVIGSIGPRLLEKPRVDARNAYQPPVFTSVESWLPVDCIGPVVNDRCHGTWQHPLGTTHEGKDVLVSVIYGMEVSMQVGLIAAFITVTIATVVGISAAYFGGWVDTVLMRYVDLQITFPTFFLYLVVVYLYGGSLFSMIVIFGLLGWGNIARIVRSEALQRRDEPYVLAAKNAGASSAWTMRRHLLPNVSNSVITATTLLIPSLILFEASLSFLGLGDPTTPSWGALIAAGRDDLQYAWWISTIPGVFLFGTVLAFNFIGDALRDALDPRSMGGAR